jgi:hypothetical protein
MKKFKVLKNFIHDSKIWNAGEEFRTKDKEIIARFTEEGS